MAFDKFDHASHPKSYCVCQIIMIIRTSGIIYVVYASQLVFIAPYSWIEMLTPMGLNPLLPKEAVEESHYSTRRLTTSDARIYIHIVVLYGNAHQRGRIRDGDNIVYVIIQITIL